MAMRGWAILLLAINVMIDGVVLSWLWEWHVKTVFPVQSLSVLQASMLGLVLYTAVYEYVPKVEDDEIIMSWLHKALIVPLTALVVGFVVHLIQKA